jgi:hypothetical protein
MVGRKMLIIDVFLSRQIVDDRQCLTGNGLARIGVNDRSFAHIAVVGKYLDRSKGGLFGLRRQGFEISLNFNK